MNEDAYKSIRMREILSLLPFINNLLSSPWSNIRSLSYGLLCFWVKPHIVNKLKYYIELNVKQKDQYEARLKNELEARLFEIIQNLLINEESECRTGGLNIIGSLCGLGYDFEKVTEQIKDVLGFFRRCEYIVPEEIWESVYKIQTDWDTTNQAAALALIQLCAPKELVQKLQRKQFLSLKRSKRHGSAISSGQFIDTPKIEREQDNLKLFWVEHLNSNDIRDFISMFRNEYKVLNFIVSILHLFL